MLNPRRTWRVLATRPRLWWSVTAGVAVALAVPDALTQHGATRALLGFNTTTLLYLALAAHLVLRSDGDTMRRRALRQSEGRMLVLALAVVSSVAVLLAIASQLAVVKDLHGIVKTRHVALAALTVISAWLFTQTLFAMHYAHDFYLLRHRGHADALQFPGTPNPDYGDFLYFACVIGTSGQTADVAFAHPSLRRVGLLHCVLAFFFNTTVLALTINIAAGLF